MIQNIPVTKVPSDPREIPVEVLARSGTLPIPVEASTSDAIENVRHAAYEIAKMDLHLENDPRSIDVERLGASEAENVLRQRAELRQIAIRHMEFTVAISDAALIEEALEAYRSKDWEHMGMTGPAEWMDASITNPKWRTILKSYVPAMLLRLDSVEVVDKNGERVTPERFTRGRRSFIEEVGPVLSRLEDTPEDVEVFKELVAVAATDRKEDVRSYLENRGLRSPHFDKEEATVKVFNRVDEETGEIKTISQYVIEADTEQKSRWIEAQLQRRYRFPIPTTVNLPA